MLALEPSEAWEPFSKCRILTAELDDFKPIVSSMVWLVTEVANLAVMLSEEGGLATGHASYASENRCKGGSPQRTSGMFGPERFLHGWNTFPLMACLWGKM